jgi:hypothetical protein
MNHITLVNVMTDANIPKALMVPRMVAIKNGGLLSSSNGVFRHDSKQQRGQQNVEQKEVHPCQTGFRQTLGPAAGEADEDQAEIRQRQVENIDHGDPSFSSLLAPDRQRGRTGNSKG